MGDKPIDYYATLEVSPTATPEEIRTAYKKSALKWHPDRVPSDSPERATRTKKFQQINDAYFTLSDAERRRQYDSVRQWTHGDTESEPADEDIPRDEPKKGNGPWGWFFGGNSKSSSNNGDGSSGPGGDFGERQWSSAFEEMMRDADLGEEETQDGGQKRTKPTQRFWSMVGTVSGGTLGFIVGNVTGMFAGGVAGNRLGAIRDAHGKSVYAVFQDLPQQQKARVLSELAAKIFAQAVSG